MRGRSGVQGEPAKPQAHGERARRLALGGAVWVPPTAWATMRAAAGAEEWTVYEADCCAELCCAVLCCAVQLLLIQAQASARVVEASRELPHLIQLQPRGERPFDCQPPSLPLSTCASSSCS